MKGGFYGLKVSQVSLILIGFVCVAVLMLVWTQTTLLDPPEGSVLLLTPVEDQEDSDLSGGISTTDNLEKKLDAVKPTGSSDPISFRGIDESDNLSNSGDEKQVEDPEDSDLSGGKSTTDNLEKKLDAVKPTGSSDPISFRGIDESENLSNSGDEKQDFSLIVMEGARRKDVNNSSSKLAENDSMALGSNARMKSSNMESSAKGHYNQYTKTLTKEQECNFGKGKWVIDDSRPLYSGFHCKQWLSSMWACRLTQRTDFEYEKLRWQPKDCYMEDFTGANFLKMMFNKTLAFVGDSLGRQQFQSMMCMITGGEEMPVLDVGSEYGLVTASGSTRPDGWAFRFPRTNTTVLYYWSASLCDLEPLDISNPQTDVAMHLDRPPAFLRQFLHRFDVLVLNTGHHWNRGKLKANRWIMYVDGVPNTDKMIAVINGAKNLTVHSIIGWVNSQFPKYPGLKAFYRTISPRHFFNGEWNTGRTCDNTSPLSAGKEVLKDESSDPVAASAVKGTGVKLLDITALSELRAEGHKSRYSIRATPGVQDCLHWCLPGVPDTWNEILFAQI